MNRNIYTMVVAGIVAALCAGLASINALPLPVLIVSVPFLFLLCRQPVMRRLAVRNAVRRPRETALVLLGSLLGTAIITGSYVVGDTLHGSISRSAYTQLGPIDEVVQASQGSQADEVEAALGDFQHKDVDGSLKMTLAVAAVATPGKQPKAQPRAQVLETDFAVARTFGGDPNRTGISGPTPREGEAVVGENLAATLEVAPDDEIVVYAYGGSRTLKVVRIIPQEGVAGYYTQQDTRSPNVFVTPGTLAAMAAGAPPGATPPTRLFAYSNRGGVVEGREYSDAVKAALQKKLKDTPATVTAEKDRLLTSAEEVGNTFTDLFRSVGAFSVLAGILLLVNIFVMLAEERKTELGMARAVGMRRASLVGSFSLEGWIYALAAAAIGTVAGLGVGRLIVLVAAGIFASGDQVLKLRYAVERSSLVQGFTLGALISLVTVVITSLRISRLNVIRAIRDLPEPDSTGRQLLGMGLGAGGLVVGAMVTAGGIAAKNQFMVLIGPCVIIAGLVPLVRQVMPRRAVVSSAAVLVIAWAVWCIDVVPRAFENPNVLLFVLEGAVGVAAAVALISQNQNVVARGIRFISGGSRAMAARLGLAYPLARPFRTVMVLSMYALVVLSLAWITVFSHLFSQQVDQQTARASGGWDLQIPSNQTNPVPVSAVRARKEVIAVAPMSVLPAEFTDAAHPEFSPWLVGGYGETYLGPGVPELRDRAPKYKTDAAAYRGILEEPGLIIVPSFFLSQGADFNSAPAKVGQTVVMRNPLLGLQTRLKIAAVSGAGFGNERALVSMRTLREAFGATASINLTLARTASGVDPQEFADRINGDFIANGADAESYRKTVMDNLAQQEQFIQLMRGYLALGLVVGIAGLGVVMVRAVRERRRQIGVLRSLGFEAGSVRRAFLAESAFVAFEGIAIGSLLSLVTSWRMVGSGVLQEKLPFTVPWVQIALLMFFTFVASLIATLAPAQQASKIPPAVALRITD